MEFQQNLNDGHNSKLNIDNLMTVGFNKQQNPTLMQSQYTEMKSPHSAGGGIKSPSTVGMIDQLDGRIGGETFGEHLQQPR